MIVEGREIDQDRLPELFIARLGPESLPKELPKSDSPCTENSEARYPQAQRSDDQFYGSESGIHRMVRRAKSRGGLRTRYRAGKAKYAVECTTEKQNPIVLGFTLFSPTCMLIE
jgi:hypothetical protein